MKEVKNNLVATNVYDSILKMYVKNVHVDEGEKWKTIPFFIGEKAIALNNHEICFFDKELIDGDNLFACGFDYPKKIIGMIATKPNMNFI